MPQQTIDSFGNSTNTFRFVNPPAEFVSPEADGQPHKLPVHQSTGKLVWFCPPRSIVPRQADDTFPLQPEGLVSSPASDSCDVY